MKEKHARERGKGKFFPFFTPRQLHPAVKGNVYSNVLYTIQYGTMYMWKVIRECPDITRTLAISSTTGTSLVRDFPQGHGWRVGPFVGTDKTDNNTSTLSKAKTCVPYRTEWRMEMGNESVNLSLNDQYLII